MDQSKIDNYRDWAQLCRTHTTPLEMVPAIIGAALATGSLLNPFVLFWGFFGFLYHQAGYLQNSFNDYQQGYDDRDPYKQHFPLRRGSKGPVIVGFVSIWLLIITVVVGLAGVIYTSVSIDFWSGVISMVILATGAYAGSYYNNKGKEAIYKAIPISYAHSTVFIVPYIASGGESIVIALNGWAFVFLWVLYQIHFSGELKDITVDKADNWMNQYVNGDYLSIPHEVRVRSTVLKGVSAIMAITLTLSVGGTLTQGTLPAVVVLLSIPLGIYMLRAGVYERDTRIRSMALIELLMLSSFCLATIPALGSGVVALIVLSVVWVLVFNSFEWGTLLSPKV